MVRPAASRAMATSSGGGELLDHIMHTFDFGSRYEIMLPAPAARVVQAVDTYRLDSSLFVRVLFRLRGLGPAPGNLRTSLPQRGFTILAEDPGREIVVGVAGRFWALDEMGSMIRVSDAAAFVAFDQAGAAKAAANLRIEAVGAATTRLSTETRVQCVDTAAYRRFALYWSLIRPFSGWIRRDMLRRIRRHTLALRD
jgi:hypothetical protein